MDGDKSSIMVMEPPSPQCVGEWHLLSNLCKKSPIFMGASEASSLYNDEILEDCIVLY